MQTIAQGCAYDPATFVSTALFAQNRVISGKVTDSKDGSPVAGASVSSLKTSDRIICICK